MPQTKRCFVAKRIEEREIESKIRKAISRVAGISEEKIKPTSRLREDLGIDSFSALDLAYSIEEDFKEFTVELDDQKLRTLATVEDVCGLIVKECRRVAS